MPTVLIADDDARLRLLVSATLSSSGFRLLEATDGDQAWSTLCAERPEAAVLDLMMPGKTGLELARLIRGDPQLKDMRVILLTGSDQPGGSIEGQRAGADLYLTKPFSPQALFDAVTCDFAIPEAQPARSRQLSQLHMHASSSSAGDRGWRPALTVHLDPPGSTPPAVNARPAGSVPVNWPPEYIDERELFEALGCTEAEIRTDPSLSERVRHLERTLDRAHQSGRIRRYAARTADGTVAARAYRREAVAQLLAELPAA